jgi:hypothetical protein
MDSCDSSEQVNADEPLSIVDRGSGRDNRQGGRQAGCVGE